MADQLIHRAAVLRIGLRNPETEGGLVKYAVLLPLVRYGLLRLSDPLGGAVFVLSSPKMRFMFSFAYTMRFVTVSVI